MTVNAASRWSPSDYAGNAAFVPALGAAALALLDPKPGEAILDLGCGDGVLTEKIVAAGALSERWAARGISPFSAPASARS